MCDAQDACPGTVLPEMSASNLGLFRWAETSGDNVFESKTIIGAYATLTLADTAGCSCTQIGQALGLPSAVTKKGCTSLLMFAWALFH